MHKNKLRNVLNSLIALTAIHLASLSASNTTIYNSQENKSEEQAVGYSKTNQSLSRYLAYRDIPSLITKYVYGTNTLDYGAGTGSSTQFLLNQNLDVIGVDISKEMLSLAKINCPNTAFHLITNGNIPAASKTFDFIFSSFVLFELGSEQEVIAYLEEAKRVVKDDGVLIAITGSQDLYSRDWFIYGTNYPENRNLKSGDLAKLYLYEAAIEFTDFYWTEADYRHFFKKAGFDILDVHYPLGKDNEEYPWKDEKITSPFFILVAKKKCLG